VDIAGRCYYPGSQLPAASLSPGDNAACIGPDDLCADEAAAIVAGQETVSIRVAWLADLGGVAELPGVAHLAAALRFGFGRARIREFYAGRPSATDAT
jgi:hypothetical protein